MCILAKLSSKLNFKVSLLPRSFVIQIGPIVANVKRALQFGSFLCHEHRPYQSSAKRHRSIKDTAGKVSVVLRKIKLQYSFTYS